MRKKILLSLAITVAICIFLLTAYHVLAAPTSRLERTLLPETTNYYELGTSTRVWLNAFVKNASTTGTSADYLCLGSDCRNSWSSVGSAYPFQLAGNATSTLTQFNGGLTASASSTIGGGTQTGGLTISGGSTTTLNAYFASNVGIGTTTPGLSLSISGTSNVSNGGSTPIGILLNELSNTSTWVPNQIYNGIRFGSADTSTTGAGLSAMFGVFKTSTNGGLDGFAFDLATSTNAANVPNLRALSISQATGRPCLTVGTTTTVTCRLVELWADDTSTGTTGQGNSSFGVYNTNTTDNTFAELAFGGLDTSQAKLETSKIVGVTTSHTAGAANGDIAFVNKSAGVFSERARITSAGMVGIGTAAPSTRLHLAGNLSLTTAFSSNGTSFRSQGGTFTDTVTTPGSTISTASINSLSSQSTLAFGNGTSTITNASTLYIANAPLANPTNAIITVPLAVHVDNGEVRFDNNLQIGVNTSGYAATNPLIVAGSTTADASSSEQIHCRSLRTAIVSGNLLCGIGIESADTNVATAGNNQVGTTTAYIHSYATETHTASALGTNLTFGTTANGTTALTERLRIDQNGNLGVGTTTPWGNLSVINSGGSTPGFVVSSSSNVPQLLVDGSGKVGIGTTSPSNFLTVYNASNASSQASIQTPGTGTSQQAILSLITLANGSSWGSAGNLGWSINALGNAWSTASGQNDFNLTYWDGSAFNTAMTIDSLTRNVGIGTTTPWGLLSINPTSALGSAPAFVIGSSTQTLFQISNTGKIVGNDTANTFTGVISPTRRLVLQTGTTTLWTASTTGTAYSPFVVMPFTGTIKDVFCATDASFLGVNLQLNGSNVTPSYFVASTTVGTIPFTAGNSFSKGQKLLMNVGTTTTASTQSLSCTFDVVETP